MHVESGPCAQVIGFAVCVGTQSACSGKQDLQEESE
jgi:hypothetical protein